jgi:hypothetical protein
MMQDLIIEDIKFLDQFGFEQTWSAIVKSCAEDLSVGVRDHFDRNEFKKRLVRQIIRKHLLCQGMGVDGASIEICTARG